MTEELAARVQRLEDVEAARGLFYTYAKTLDDPDPDAVAALFTDDAVLQVPGGTFSGRQQIGDFYAQAFAVDPSLKRHFIVNLRVAGVRDRVVEFESYLLYIGRGDESIIGWGTYVDKVDVSGSRPAFAEKTIEIHHATTLAQGWAVPSHE